MPELDPITISELPSNTLSGSDKVPVENSTATGKATIDELVAASALNGRFAYKSNVSLDTLTNSGLYFCDNCTNAPSTSQYYAVTVIATSTGTSAKQIAQPIFTNGYSYQRYRSSTSGWSAWVTMPTRDEVDRLKSKVYVQSEYKDVTTYPLTISADPANGAVYLVVFKHWTSSTTIVADIGMLTFFSGPTPYFTFITQNKTTPTISSLSISGRVVNFTFSGTVYLEGFAIKLSG